MLVGGRITATGIRICMDDKQQAVVPPPATDNKIDNHEIIPSNIDNHLSVFPGRLFRQGSGDAPGRRRICKTDSTRSRLYLD